jgi:hypothetical protein
MWKDVPHKSYIYISLAFSAVSAVIIFAVKDYLPPVVPFFYGLPSGANQLTPTLGLLIAPTVALIVTAINIMLTKITKDQFFKKALIFSSVFVSVLMFITTIKIILLVGFF